MIETTPHLIAGAAFGAILALAFAAAPVFRNLLLTGAVVAAVYLLAVQGIDGAIATSEQLLQKAMAFPEFAKGAAIGAGALIFFFLLRRRA
jgi:hypothetical protein